MIRSIERVLVAGLGSIGQRHVRNLRARLGASVDILAFRVRGRSQVLSDDMTVLSNSGIERSYGVRAFDSLSDALAEKPTAVFVCNPTSQHLSVAVTAARAGCHVFIEKPISHSAEGVDELVDVVERSGLVGAVGYQLRFHPALHALRRLIADRRVGRILSVSAEFGEHLPDAHPYEDYREGYAARSDLGGGVLLSYIHEFDYLWWLFGMPTRIYAVGGHLSQLEVDVEDTVVTLMDVPVDGGTVPVSVRLTFAQRRPSRTCRVIGETGEILLDLRAPSVTVTDEGGADEVLGFPNFQRNRLFMDELDAFLDAIVGRGRPAVDLRDAGASLAIALVAAESMRTGRAVEMAGRMLVAPGGGI